MISHSASTIAAGDFSYVAGLVRANFVGPGGLSERFRDRLARFAGRGECVLTNSGTAALEISLNVLRRATPKRSHVAVSSYVCPAVVSAIVREGLKPVFLDVMPDSMSISIESARDRVDGRTLAIICTNIGGVPDDYSGAGGLGCAVVSDCAQGIGANWGGRPIAELGEFAVFSFGPTKMLTAGAGGAMLSSRAEAHHAAAAYARGELDVAEYCRHGFRATYGQSLPDLNAGLGLSQLRRMGAFLRKRQAIAKSYAAVLGPHGLGAPPLPVGASSNHYRYYFLSERSGDWIALLRRAGIDARASVAHSMADYFPRIGRLPNLKKNAATVVSLPIYPGLAAREVGRIADALRKAVDKGLR